MTSHRVTKETKRAVRAKRRAAAAVKEARRRAGTDLGLILKEGGLS